MLRTLTARLARAGALACGLVTLAGGPILADYPEEPIKIVVPFKPGGMSTNVATLFQKVFDARPDILGTKLVIVHVPGGASAVGARRVKDAEPDGYEFLLVHLALLSRQAAGLVDFGYKDFEPVVQAIGTCLVPSVIKDAPYRDLPALMKAAKEKPDTIVFGVNLGALNHMGGLVLQATHPGAQFRFVQIGAGNAVFVALKGGHIDVGVFSIGVYNKFEPGGVRALALMAPKRHPAFPDLPTARELGFEADFCFENWWFAPKGTPQKAIDHFADAIQQAVETKEAAKFIKDGFFIKSFLRGDEMKKRIDEVWGTISPVGAKLKK